MSNINLPENGYVADIDQRLRLAREYVSNMRNPFIEGRPYFGVHRAANGEVFARTGGMTIDLPHITGRALDVLFCVEGTLSEKTDPDIENDYVRWFYDAMNHDLHVPVFVDWTTGERCLETHNLRQAAEALAHLITKRGCQKAKEYAVGMLDTLEKITDFETGLMSSRAADNNITDSSLRKVINSSVHHPRTLSSGRLAEPLLKIYDATGDKRALKLAELYAKSVNDVFDENGKPIISLSGDHVHSITSSLSSMLAVAIRTDNKELISRAKTIYDHFASSDYMTDYGWIKEQIELKSDTGRGESNQVGDMIQIQLMMASVEEPAKWYSRAEKFVRGGILPTQVFELPGTPNYPFKPDDSHRDMKSRCIGGWGFPSPTSFLVLIDGAVNTIDITQGAVQSLCAVKNNVLTEAVDGVRLNMFFSSDSDLGTVESNIPFSDKVSVVLKKTSKLLIRVPENIKEGSFKAYASGTGLAFEITDGYADLGSIKADERVEITFQESVVKTSKVINGVESEITWYGEQVNEVIPERGPYPLYGILKL